MPNILPAIVHTALDGTGSRMSLVNRPITKSPAKTGLSDNHS